MMHTHTLSGGANTPGGAKKRWIKMPREHGGWVMIGVGLALGAVVSQASVGVVVLLGVAAVAGFFAHEPLRALLARQKREAAAPLILTVGIAAAAGVWARAVSGADGLFVIGGLDGVLLAIYAAKLRGRGRERADRSVVGQVVASLVLTSLVPATMLAGGASLFSPWPWALWGVCFVYFCGGILLVHALLEAARKAPHPGATRRPSPIKRERVDVKPAWNAEARWRHAQGFLACHAALLALMWGSAGVAAMYLHSPWAALALTLAPTPAGVRALARWRALGPELPSMKRVGMGELALSLWFGAWLAVAAHVLMF